MRHSFLKRQRYILLFFGIFLVTASYAQNGPPIYTDYLNFKSIINPSFVGREKVFTVFVGANNVLSSEQTGVLAVTTPVGASRWSLGLITSYDEIGISRNISIAPSVSYTLPLGEEGQQLRFGLTGTYNSLGNNYEKLIKAPDNFLSGHESFTYYSFGAGISLYLKNTFFSVSIPEIYARARTIEHSNLHDLKKGRLTQAFSNIYIMQRIELNPNLYLYPSVTAYVSDFDDLGNFMLYGNVALSYHKLTLGLTALLKTTKYESIITSSLGASFSIDVNRRLSLGYSYRNLSLRKLQSFSNIQSLFLKYSLIRNKELRHSSNVF